MTTTIQTVAQRAAHQAWDGGGGLARTSRPASERYQPTAADLEFWGVTPEQRAEFSAEFERVAREAAGEPVAECAYCGREVEQGAPPALADDVAWTALANKHVAECEWVATRAHRQ